MPLAATHLDLSPGLTAVLVVFSLVNLALVLIALVSLITRPNAAVRFHNKWVWGALIVLVNGIGPLAYLALGRVDAPFDEAVAPWTQRPAAERARAAVELLYGPGPAQVAPSGASASPAAAAAQSPTVAPGDPPTAASGEAGTGSESPS